MTKYHEQIIADRAAEIKKRIEGGTIYGIPVDMNNIDHIIVAVYCLCEMKETQRSIERLEVLRSLT